MFSSLYNAFGGWTHAEDSSTSQPTPSCDIERHEGSLQQQKQAITRLQTIAAEGSDASGQDEEDLDEVSMNLAGTTV
jgi:hypothetical protein